MMHNRFPHSLIKVDDLNAILSYNLSYKVRLLDNETSTELKNTFLHCDNTIFQGHVLLEAVVED